MSYRGRQIFMETLVGHGVRHLFGNPGTTESPIMDSLLDYPQVEYVLALHESVAVGAAHYYAQASGTTAVVNLHVAPGLGNGLGMLYNAQAASTPMVVTAGQQDTRMRLREPLLGHDLVAMARPLTKWAVQAERADELPLMLRRAFKVASDPPSGPVFVALPINVMEEETASAPQPPGTLYRRSRPDPSGIEEAATLLAGAKRPALVVGDGVAFAGAQPQLVELAELLGAPVYYSGLHHQIDFPTGHPNCRELVPFDHGALRRLFGDADVLLLVGGTFFDENWFDEGSPFPDGAAVLQIEAASERLSHNFPLAAGILGDPRCAVEELVAALAARVGEGLGEEAARRNEALAAERAAERERQRERARDRWDRRPIAPARLMAELEARLPADAVVVNEAITATADLKRTLSFERAGDYYGTRGGGIGQALAGALGVQLAHPGRRVVAVSGDGSSLYSIQALWSAAHHRLPILFLILHNRSYRILKFNLDAYQRRFGLPGDRPYPHMDLTEPDIDFVAVAAGFGVQGSRVEDPGALGHALETAFASEGPYLLDVILDGGV